MHAALQPAASAPWIYQLSPQASRQGAAQATDADEDGPWERWALNRLEHGIVVLQADGRVLHANRCAYGMLASGRALDASSGWLTARQPQELATLREALRAVAERGLCRMLGFGSGEAAQFVALSAISAPGGTRLILCMLGQRTLGNPLTLQWYAQCHGLTSAEAAVLRLICAGDDPGGIAARQGVAISTVRTQIGSIRAKTGHKSIRALLRTLACLPSMSGALFGST